jgi:spore coat assembly protein SafA
MIQYIVEKGDTLWKIAKAYNISLDSLIAANPQIADPNLIYTGSVINIPDVMQTIPMPPESDPKAMRFNNRSQFMRAASGTQPMSPYMETRPVQNRQMPSKQMPSGQTPPSNQQAPYNPFDYYAATLPACDDTNMRPCIYTAAAGDTLEGISQKYMVPLSRLMYYNLNYGRNEAMTAGTRVIIPEDTSQWRDLPSNYNTRYRRR